MKIKQIFSFTFIFIMIIFLVSNFSYNLESEHEISKKNPYDQVESSSYQCNDSYSPKFKTDEIPEKIPYKTNVYPSGDFERYDSDGTLEEFSETGVTKHMVRNSTYTGNTANGIYAGLLEAEGATTYGGGLGIEYYFQKYPKVAENVSFNMWMKIDQPDVKTGGYSLIHFFLNNGSTYTMYYIVSFSPTGYNPTSDWNGTNYQYLMVNQTHGSWTYFHRNITADVEKVFGYADPNLEIQYFYIETFSPKCPAGISRIIIDDVSITNGTNKEFIVNGNFEEGDGNHWQSSYVGSKGDIVLTDEDTTQGSKALNMTAYRLPETTDTGSIQIYDYLSNPSNGQTQGYYFSDNGSFTIEFDYKYSDIYNGGGQLAYFILMFRNQTTHIDWYTWLGADCDENYQTNDTIGPYFSFTFNSSTFGVRDSWQHLSINPANLFKEWNIDNVTLSYIRFHVITGTNDNSSIQLLVDNFQIITYPTGDPGFEEAWYPPSIYHPLTGWYRDTGQYPNISLTTESHSDNFALNLTARGLDQGVWRDLNLKIDPGTFTSFWWKLIETTSKSGSFFHLTINDTFNVYYIIANNGMTYSNASNRLYFIHENATKIGTWYNLVINIWKDFTDEYPFLISTNLVLTFIEIGADIENQGEISILFDDIHFLHDSNGPDIHSVERIIPVAYYNPTKIEINVTDNISGIDSVYIYYSIDSNNWYPIRTSYSNDVYQEYIPVMSFDTTVNYYVIAKDRSNNPTRWPLEGYESYDSSFLGPKLSDVQLNPFVPQYGKTVKVTVAVDQYDSLENVTLSFKTENGSWQKTDMITDTGALYYGTLPAADWGMEVFFYISAFGEFNYISSIGNMTNPLTYIVGDEVNPILNVIGPTSSIISGVVDFSINATDEGSGINQVEIIVDGEHLTSLTVFPTSFSWNTKDLSNGEHTITYLASDNAENSVEVELTFTISNPKGLDFITAEINSILTQYGFILGALSVIGVYAVIKIILWKRSRRK